jgi:hypothetical protein
MPANLAVPAAVRVLFLGERAPTASSPCVRLRADLPRASGFLFLEGVSAGSDDGEDERDATAAGFGVVFGVVFALAADLAADLTFFLGAGEDKSDPAKSTFLSLVFAFVAADLAPFDGMPFVADLEATRWLVASAILLCFLS